MYKINECLQSVFEGLAFGYCWFGGHRVEKCSRLWGCNAEVSLAELNPSLDRGKNRSTFDADLRTVGRVDSVKTGCIKLVRCGFAVEGEMDR